MACGGDEVPKPTEKAKAAIPSSKPAPNQEQLSLEYKRLNAELDLAQSKKPYMILDLKRKLLVLKLGGAKVWDYALTIADADSDDIADFGKRLSNPESGFTRRVKAKHLFAAKDQTPDSILSIVGGALKVDPTLMQRELPEKFQLVFDDGFIMEFRSDVKGETESTLKNTYLTASQAIKRLFGNVYIVTTIEPEAAMTLYRAADVGLAMMVVTD